AVGPLFVGDDGVGDRPVVGELTVAAVDLADPAPAASAADRVGIPRLVQPAQHGLIRVEVDDLAGRVDRDVRHGRSFARGPGRRAVVPHTEVVASRSRLTDPGPPNHRRSPVRNAGSGFGWAGGPLVSRHWRETSTPQGNGSLA